MAGAGQTRLTESLPAGFGGGESGLRSLRDHRALLLGDGGGELRAALEGIYAFAHPAPPSMNCDAGHSERRGKMVSFSCEA
jgi:hypothetical protein